MSNNEATESSISAPFSLAVENLKTYYLADHTLVRAVDGISFGINQSEKIGIAGESGSGKTQTALSIMGLTFGQPGIVAGKISINKIDVLKDYSFAASALGQSGNGNGNGGWHAARKKHDLLMQTIRGKSIAMVFQEPKASLSPYFSVQEQLQETFLAHQPAKAEVELLAQIELLMLELGFEDPRRIMKSYPHQLSGGECQRVMIALGLISNPQLFIADEPTTALDAVTQYRVIEHLERTINKRKIALLFITHNLALLNYLVDYVIVMFSGKIVEMGTKNEVISARKNVHHPYTELLLQSVRFWADSEQHYSGYNNARVEHQKNYQGCRYFYRCPYKDGLSEKSKMRCLSSDPMLEEVSAGNQPLRIACWQRGGHD